MKNVLDFMASIPVVKLILIFITGMITGVSVGFFVGQNNIVVGIIVGPIMMLLFHLFSLIILYIDKLDDEED